MNLDLVTFHGYLAAPYLNTAAEGILPRAAVWAPV